MGKKRIITKAEPGPVSGLADTKKQEDSVAKKASLGIDEGRIYINSTYNNTIVTLTDLSGNVLTGVSAGNVGFKGTKKSTPFAASKVAEALADRAKKIGVIKVWVIIKGIGSGRESALRSLAGRGLELLSIKDVTPVPHNGCRPKKIRRV
ncbi:30S ribosomal protein S11 [Candidatus Parcubacteria bacterium]|nr:30S ribosomal protein S11 [Patescibacteria group bacterium]MCG2688267.1 30S ribosomal protein S11 [Candidatus Parcubacteria bacterium]